MGKDIALEQGYIRNRERERGGEEETGSEMKCGSSKSTLSDTLPPAWLYLLNVSKLLLGTKCSRTGYYSLKSPRPVACFSSKDTPAWWLLYFLLGFVMISVYYEFKLNTQLVKIGKHSRNVQVYKAHHF